MIAHSAEPVVIVCPAVLNEHKLIQLRQNQALFRLDLQAGAGHNA